MRVTQGLTVVFKFDARCLLPVFLSVIFWKGNDARSGSRLKWDGGEMACSANLESISDTSAKSNT